MKLFKTGTALQLIYILCCLTVVLCMPLYTAFYTTGFGMLCLRIGGIFTLICTVVPIGLVGTVLCVIGCFRTSLMRSKKHLAWTVLSSLLTVFSWVLAISSFVYHTGGV